MTANTEASGISRDVFVWEGGMFRFGGPYGEAQNIGVKLDKSFLLEGMVVREVIDPTNGKVVETTRLSTNVEKLGFKPTNVTSVHPSVTAVEGIITLDRPTYTRDEMVGSTVVMMVYQDQETGEELGKLEIS